MTARAWVAARGGGVPASLAGRVDAALSACNPAAGEQPSATLVDAAVQTLRDVLRDEPMTREHALGLLTADALATYAFEAAAEAGTLMECTGDALVRIAAAATEAA